MINYLLTEHSFIEQHKFNINSIKNNKLFFSLKNICVETF